MLLPWFPTKQLNPARLAVVIEVVTLEQVRQIVIQHFGGFSQFFTAFFPKYFTAYFPSYWRDSGIVTTSNVQANIYLGASTTVFDTEYFRYVKNSNTRMIYFSGVSGGSGGFYSFSVSSTTSYIRVLFFLPNTTSVNKAYWVPVFLQKGIDTVPAQVQFFTTYDSLTGSTSIEMQLYAQTAGGIPTSFTTGNVYSISFPPFVFEGSSFSN